MRYGLIGWPLGHSISPQLHRRLAGVEYDLRPLPEAEFERFMRERDFSAVNVTIPYKRQVLPYCAQLTPAARRCGSVNLLIKGRDGTLTGDNTDLAGLEFLLGADRPNGGHPGERRYRPYGQSGCGGAGGGRNCHREPHRRAEL